MRIEVDLPHGMPDERRRDLLAAEAVRGRELRATGTIRRIWRVPGRLANVSLYDAADPTALHEVLSALPLWPWMDIRVEALARHPLEAEDENPRTRRPR